MDGGGDGFSQFLEQVMSINVGDKLPGSTFVKMTENGPEQVHSDEFFKGRKVALFSVPGAFTPTCSTKHLPGFVEKANQLKAKGIDEIACTAVNDAFVIERKSVVSGKSVSVRVDLGGRRIIKKKNNKTKK